MSKVISPKDKVGDVLKSDKVDNLLNKVTDESDDEDSKRLKQDEEKDEDWEEVKKPESLKESTPELSKKEDYISKLKPKAKEMKEESKAESVKEESKAEPVKTEEKKLSPSPKLEQPVQAKKDVKKDVSKEITPTLDDPKEEEPKKELPRKEDSKKEESKATGAPTLRSTVDKLAKLVESLESQVVKLTEANADKNSKIDLLEKKIEELLKK